MLKNKVKAVIYARTHSKENAREGEASIQDQITNAMAYIVEHPDLELVDSYADDGFDGVALQKPGFLEILDGIMAGEIDCIVVDDICRISSNMLELAYIMTDILPEMDGAADFFRGDRGERCG